MKSASKMVRLGLRGLFKMTPRSVRDHLIGSMIQLPRPEDAGEITFKIAESKAELEAAFRILHDEYVSSKFMEPHPSGLRITKYHALPTTTTLIALHRQQVIATVSIIRAGALGLPIDAVAKYRHKVGATERVAEISSLAIRRDYQGNRGAVLFPLLKFLYEYAVTYFGVDHFLIAVHPRRYSFYESLLGFEKITSQKLKRYEFANGAPAIIGFLNLKKAKTYVKKFSNKKRPHQDFSRFFDHKTNWPGFLFPKRKYAYLDDIVMDTDKLSYFFTNKSNLLHQISALELFVIYGIYGFRIELQPVHESLRPIPNFLPTDRQEMRFEVKIEGHLRDHSSSKQIVIHDVSKSGMCMSCDLPLQIGQILNLDANLNQTTTSRLMGKVVNARADQTYGCMIMESDDHWLPFIAHLMAQYTAEEEDALRHVA